MSPELSLEKHHAKEKQLDAGMWGVFFLWLGIAFLVHIPWSFWLIGVGAIILAAQLARRLFALRVDVFWLVAGAIFMLGGISEIGPFHGRVALIPLLFIAAGIALLAKAVMRRGGPSHA